LRALEGVGQFLEEKRHHGRHRGVVFGRELPGLAIEVYGDSHGDVFDVSHSLHSGWRVDLQALLVISSVRQGGVIFCKGRSKGLRDYGRRD
jgi:hypothetical protein